MTLLREYLRERERERERVGAWASQCIQVVHMTALQSTCTCFSKIAVDILSISLTRHHRYCIQALTPTDTF